MQPTVKNRLFAIAASLTTLLLVGCQFTRLDSVYLGKKTPEPFVYHVMSQSNAELNGIAQFDRNIWIVGDGGELLISHDSGENWKRIESDSGDLLCITRTANSTLIAGSRSGKVLVSRDDGDRWSSVDAGTDAALFSSFAVSEVAYLAGDHGTIVRSSDAGQNWTRLAFPDNTQLLRSIWVSADQRRIVVSTDSGAIYSTSDIRTGWRRVWTSKVGAINSIAGDPGGTVLIAVGEHAQILRSTDGGSAWESMPSSFTNDLVDVIPSTSSNAFYAVGGNGLILKGIDSGSRWDRVFAPANRTLRGIQVTSQGQLEAVGFAGTILKGPESALTVLEGSSIRMHGIQYTHKFGLSAYGQGGLILFSHDKGATWERRQLATDAEFLALKEWNGGLWAIGDHGTTATSEDGIRWTVNRSLPDIKLNDLAITPDGSTIYIAADEGKVYSSFDKGAHFAEYQTSSSNSLLSVSFARSLVFAVGAKGTIVQTTLGTNAWTLVPQDASYDFNSVVASPDGLHLWVFGSNSAVFYSSDLGASWDYDENSVGDDLYSAACTNNCKQVVSVGQNGTVVVGTSSNDDWVYQTKSAFDLRSVTASADGSLFGLGSDFTIYRPKAAKGAWEQAALGYVKGAVEGPDGKRLFAVTDSGKVFATVSNGVDWSVAASTSGETLYGIAADARGLGLAAVGAKGTVGRSSDGGTSWSFTKISQFDINGIAETRGHFVAVGDRGYVYRSTPGDATWTVNRPISNRTLQSVSASADGKDLWIVGTRGLILHSSDAGATWTQQALGETTFNSVTVYGVAPYTIVAVGDGGSIAVSKDSGKTWLLHMLGGSSLFAVLHPPKTTQLIAVGGGGRLLLSDDDGESWYAPSSGTDNDLTSLTQREEGGQIFALGEKGIVKRLTRFGPRFSVDVSHLSHVFSGFDAEVITTGLTSTVKPVFTVRASRESELNRLIVVDLPTTVDTSVSNTFPWKVHFDVSPLKPRVGETFNLSLCLTLNGYSRCRGLPRMTAVPWIDAKRDAKWLVPGGLLGTIVCGLSVLLFTRPLWILVLYRRATLYDLAEKASIPGAGFIKLALQGTLVPWFAFHPKTLRAWVSAHRTAIHMRVERDLSYSMALGSERQYVSLPVEVVTKSASELIVTPSSGKVLPFLRGSAVVEICGPGGIGKTTLLRQIAVWLLGLGSGGKREHSDVAVLVVEPYTTDLLTYLATKLAAVVEEEVSIEFVKQLLAKGYLAVAVDSFSELPVNNQEQLRRDIGILSCKLILISSREPTRIQPLENIVIFPKPLDSRTLLHFVTSLLAQSPDQTKILFSMEVQLELATRIARLMSSAGDDVPLTPLLARLYVDRAVELFNTDEFWDELPRSIAEAYFEFIRFLLRRETRIEQGAALSSIKRIGALALANRYVPSKMMESTVLGAIGPDLAKSTNILQGLISAGILMEDQIGPSTIISFALDPVAEFSAAYFYAERFEGDMAAWSRFQGEVGRLGASAKGFRDAVSLVVQARYAKGLCPPELTDLWREHTPSRA